MPRLEVLRVVALQTKPIGAYEIVAKLQKVMNNPKPQTIYRALDFWTRTGFIHPIKSMNAFVLCRGGCTHPGAYFLVCGACGTAEEAFIHEMPSFLQESINAHSFDANHWMLEVHGTCQTCQSAKK